MSNFYCTTFCNRAHRLSDGKPIDHECYIIPPKLLEAERNETENRFDLWADWSYGNRRMHRGVKSCAT